MDYIKNHKGLIALIVAGLVIVLFVFIVIKNFFLNKSDTVYGDRFDDRVEVADMNLTNVEKALLESEYVQTASISYNAGIVNVMIDVKKEVSLETAKSLSNLVLENLNETTVKDYDIQIYLTRKTEVLEEGKTSDYPVIGYKHRENSAEYDYSSFAW